jgi:endonuclease YncB( thermonuclease family)
MVGVLLIAAFAVQDASVLIGKVVAVKDGDSIIVLDARNVQHEVRLVAGDAPEHDQAFGSRAKQALGGKVFGKRVRVEWTERDKHDRILGKVMFGNRWINREMIAEGYAWHYKQYSSDPELAKAEERARKRKLGLWTDPQPEAPWDFRHRSAEAAKAAEKN